MPQTNGTLKTLQNNLEEAILFLSPKFEISEVDLRSVEEPSYEIVSERKASYHPFWNCFSFGLDYIHDIMALGEEASHYLHNVLLRLKERNYIFPGKPPRKDDLDALLHGLDELVGRYGSLVYCNARDIQVKPSNEIPNFSHHFGMTREEYEMARMKHETGYRRADRIFAEFGELLLPKMARMSYAEALEALPRLAPITFYEQRVLPIIDWFRIF